MKEPMTMRAVSLVQHLKRISARQKIMVILALRGIVWVTLRLGSEPELFG